MSLLGTLFLCDLFPPLSHLHFFSTFPQKQQNDLVEDPVTCRCSGDTAACKPLPHILQDCSGVPVVSSFIGQTRVGYPVGSTSVPLTMLLI